MRKILLIFLLLAAFTSKAQLFDSIKSSLQFKPKLLVKLDARNSFVTASYSKVKGIKLGLNYNKIFRLGIGYSWMKTDYYPRQFKDSTNLRFGYGNAFMEYAFYQSKHFQFEIPIQIGIGRISYKSKADELLQKEWVPIWEPAMTFEYLFLKYFSIGVGAGYRLVIKSKDPIIEQFTSPIYIFKFNISFGDMYKDVKKSFD